MVSPDGELGTVEVWVKVLETLHHRQQLFPCHTIVAFRPAELGTVVGHDILLPVLYL